MKIFFEANNSTATPGKHKNEYLKATKLEIAFRNLIHNTKKDKPLVDSKSGAVLWGISFNTKKA